MSKLKIAILIDEVSLPAYQAEIVKELEKSEWCEILLYVKKQKSKDSYSSSSKFRLYRFLKKFDAKLFGKNAPYLASKPLDINEKSKLFEVTTQESEWFDLLRDEDITKINEYKLDVILNFGFKYIKGEILNSAKYGIWEIRHPNQPAAFWEVVENIPSTEVTLECIGDGIRPGFLIDRFVTVTHPKSMRKNYEQIMWRSHMMVVENLHRLARNGETFLENKPSKTYFYDQPTIESTHMKKFPDLRFGFSDDVGKKVPTNCQTLKAFCKLTGKYLKFTFRRFFKMDRWIILFSENENGKVNSNLSKYKRLPLPSNDYFQADPFMVDEGEKSYLFYEELDYKTLKGYLLVSEYDEAKKTFVNPQEILKKEYHLSYPNVFKYEDKYYMIPETNENSTVDLYEAENFPTKWKKVRTMIQNIKAVDATLYHKDGKWWMFLSQVQKDGFSLNDTLWLYYCDDFRTNTWKSHPLNPIVTDVTCARPAGNLIEIDGKLLRPAQNCSGVYGRGLVFNEILKLSESEYEERVVQQIRSDFADDLVAVHTFNHSKRFSVIDAIKGRV